MKFQKGDLVRDDGSGNIGIVSKVTVHTLFDTERYTVMWLTGSPTYVGLLVSGYAEYQLSHFSWTTS